MKPPAAHDAGSEGLYQPLLGDLLRTLGLDVDYEHGLGNNLYYRDASGREVEVLDLIGGFGSLLFGHSHPALVAQAQDLLARGVPHHAQGSLQETSRRLARELSRRCGGNFTVVFSNTGSEAVEAALKHAMMETGGRTFLALERAYHGKTLGALQMTAAAQHREPFGIEGLRVVRVRPNDLDNLETAFAAVDRPAGFLFEPVLGEGGIRPVDRAFARRAAELCRRRNVPLIADECQTGTGRTGTFLACEGLQVEPDYVVLSKALGGGLAKISALLVRTERYVREFDVKHASTYADDAYSSAISLKVLELLDDAALARCRGIGERLCRELRTLRDRYPDVIADIRGRGLMIGIEFVRDRETSSFILEFLASQEDLVFLLAGYLLRVHALRVAPTLSDPFTLRLEPSLLLDEPAIQKLVHGLQDVCERLRKDDAAGLSAPLAETVGAPGPLRSDGRFFAWPNRWFAARQKSAPPIRAGWLCHLIDTDHFEEVEPSLEKVDPARRERLLERFVERASPVAVNPLDFRSRAGIAARFYPILLPVTSQWMKASLDAGDTSRAQLLVERGVQMARELGCSVVSLGQYTSIVTRNGTSLRSPGVALTTGNSYTVALAIQAILGLQERRGIDPARSVLAVAGASGNIGRACAEILAPYYRRTILLGSGLVGSALRLRELADRVPRSEIAPDSGGLRAADVVVCAVSALTPPFGPENFGENSVVCDLSMPSSIRQGTDLARPDLCIIGGGIAQLPFGEALDAAAFPLRAGRIYACMAEGMLLALEKVADAAFTGSITTASVRRVEKMAETHGFELADLKQAGRLEPAPEGLIRVLPH